MLHFVLGRAGSGKSHFIREKIYESAKLLNPEEKIMLIVPEQFSFETERSFYTAREKAMDLEIGYYKHLGALLLRKVDILSFKRLARQIFIKYGGIAGKYADDVVKNVIMSLAIDQVRGEFRFYHKSADDSGFVNIILEAVSEFKNAGVTPKDLSESAEIISRTENTERNSGFFDKLNDLNLMYASFCAMLEKAYKDPLDDLSRAANKITGKDFFKGYTVFFDEFKGFTAVQYKMIRKILTDAKDVYISLCLDEKDKLFESVNNTYKRLKRISNELCVKISAPVILKEQHRFNNTELVHLEKNVFNPKYEKYNGESENSPTAVYSYLAENEYDEVDFVVSKIAESVKRGYRFRDIAVLARNIENYKNMLEHSAVKYNVPSFMDMRKSVESTSLFRFVSSLLSAASGNSWGGDIDNVLTMLKCPITKYKYDDIASFENYIYTWNIKFKQFSEDFTSHPGGFVSEFTDYDIDVLKKINSIRNDVYKSVHIMKSISGGSTAESFGKCIIEAAEAMGVLDWLAKKMREPDTFDENAPKQYELLWNSLVEILEKLSDALQKSKITLKRYENLFKIAAGSIDTGNVPQTLDAVTIGSAERVRTDNIKIIFILGANEGIFPLIPNESGIFTDAQRQLLIETGVEISNPLENHIIEERFIAYQTLCRASDEVYITAPAADITGSELSVSEVFKRVREMFGGYEFENKVLRACQSKAGAFTVLADNFREDTKETATLRRIFALDDEYKPKLEKMFRSLAKPVFKIDDNEISEKLFGRNMKLSPTRVENYYKCHFAYYCEAGLNIKERNKAELNPLSSGALLHSVIYRITGDFNGFMNMDEKTVKSRIKEELDSYLETEMGGIKNKNKRFLYLYGKTRDILLKILLRLRNEFEKSEFVPVDFELELSDEGEVPPFKLETEKGEIVLKGTVDRVDLYDKDGKKYIRVVDYKSGSGKTFNLDDINYGLNLQMLFYLFAICRNGKGKYDGAKPAGILYVPAVDIQPGLERDSGEKEIADKENSAYLPSGLLLNDREILSAMEKMEDGKDCIYIPIKYDKKGNITKTTVQSLVDEKMLANLAGKLDNLILEMYESLLNGGIEAVPTDGGKYAPCTFCKYAQICGNQV